MSDFLSLTNPVKINTMENKHYDWWYGPYDSMDEALNTIQPDHEDEGDYIKNRYQGMTFGVKNDDGVVEEFWWPTSDTSLAPVKKIVDIELVSEITEDDTTHAPSAAAVFSYVDNYMGGVLTALKNI